MTVMLSNRRNLQHRVPTVVIAVAGRLQVAEMGGAVPGVVRAGRPRSQEAFIHTKNREHGLLHVQARRLMQASVSPLEGESARQGAARSRAGGGQTPAGEESADAVARLDADWFMKQSSGSLEL